MTHAGLLAVYCGLILAASLAGGWIPLVVRLTHTRLQVATSFVAGLMLGIGLLHLLPHALEQLRSIDRAVVWMLGGLLVMFFVQRYFDFHHHDVAEEPPSAAHASCRHDNEVNAHAGPHVHAAQSSKQGTHRFSWAGAALGLTLHTVINGIALAASVETERQVRGASLVGLGTFLVIFLHKPFDAMTISTLMTVGGWPKRTRHLVNALFAMAIPAGVLLFYFGAGHAAKASPAFIGSALAFAAGSFLCISVSDLMPELQFHAHDRGKLSVSLLLGLALAILVGRFEDRGHDHGPAPVAHEGVTGTVMNPKDPN